MPTSRRAFLALPLLLPGFSARGQIRVCTACGREARPGLDRCWGCGKLYPDRPAPAPSSEPAEAPAPEKSTRESFAPEAEAAAARAAFGAGRLAEAGFSARQTRAMLALRPASSADLATEMKQLEARAREGLGQARSDCPVCRGSGGRLELALTLKGDVKQVPGPHLLCLACSGRKQVAAAVPAEHLRSGLLSARQAFLARQEESGRKLVHGAWVPADLDPETLSLETVVQLRQASAGPCAGCAGVGRDACGSCSGTGMLPCTSRDCVSGKVVCPECDGKKMEAQAVGAQRALRACRTCSARGIASCPTCEGRSYLVCSKCEGQRAVECRACRGSGESAPCRRCEGAGRAACSRCRGAGEYRGRPCEACRGGKETLCPTCQGAGRVERRY
jgi:hypothetical protein